MESMRRAERQVALLRWIALAVSALMLSDDMAAGLLARGVLFVMAYNAALHFATASPERYARWGRHAGRAASVADIVALSAGLAAAHAAVPSLHLLYVLFVVSAAYVSPGIRRVMFYTGLSL